MDSISYKSCQLILKQYNESKFRFHIVSTAALWLQFGACTIVALSQGQDDDAILRSLNTDCAL